MKMTSHILLATLLFVVAFTLQTCSNSDTQPMGPDPKPNPSVLLVTPSSGAPGTLLNISGYTLNPPDTGIELLVGNQPTPFTIDSSGIHALIPLFLDSASHWPVPPLTAQDVTLRKAGEVVALAKAVVTVDSLPHAAGSTAMLQNDFAKLTNSLRVIYSSLPIVPGTDLRLPGYQDAVMAMLDSLVAKADSSLESILAGSSSWTNGQTPDFALTDAIIASSGALDFYNEASGSLGRLTDSLTLARQQGLFCKGGGPDIDLACQMQIYVVLDDYATYFVKPTTTGYANTVGLAAGILAIGGFAFPPEKVISSLLTIFDFVYGTLAPSLFPAEISDFSLAIETDTVGVGEMTGTTVSISAINHPATIRATDVLETLITALGFAKAPSGAVQSFREVLVNAMKWALDLYRKAVEQYNAQTGNSIFIDPEAPLPQMSWGPVIITNPDLVELYSFTEDIITSDTAAFEWKGIKRGNGRIQARARAAGERSKVLLDNTLCFGCIYAGGAFGNNAPGTETKTVVVGKPASIDVQIIGLPSGVDGNVVVVGTNYSSGQLVSSKLLKNLELGDYTMTSVEVRDNSGDTYKPDPLDTSVTLQDGDQATIVVNYKPKYGNLFFTVSGLNTGTDADINVSGPNGVAFHIVNDTLVDSLEPGSYTVLANNVTESQGQVRRPDPLSQTVTIIGGETSLANVAYGGDLAVTVFYGAQMLFGAIEANYRDAGLVNDPLEEIQRQEFLDGYDTLGFQSDCSEVTGYEVVGPINAGGSVSVSSAGASASGNLTASTSGFVISSSASANADIGYDPTKHHRAGGNANCDFGIGDGITGWNTGVVLDVQNPSGDTVDIVITWSVSASSSGTGGSRGKIAMARNFDPCGYRYYNNDEILVNYFSRDTNPINPSGTRTITMTGLHAQLAFTGVVNASAMADEAAPVPANNGSSFVSLSLNVTAKLRH